jgi:raffinose/stachyose/melibiose transport system substrate-binding protein
MGGDRWFGVPNYAEYVMVYYNRDLFARHGIPVPGTFDELVAAMDAFVAEGVTPLAVGGKEYPAQQLLYQLALSRADSEWVGNLQQYEGDVDFHDEAWTYGAETFADWVDAGYISKDAAGIDAESMGVAFMSGKFPLMVSGSWWYGRVRSTVKDFAWDTMLFPGSDLTLGSSGNLWVVPEGSENKDLAYDFIDITMKKANQELLGNSGGIPVAADPAAITDEKSKTLIDNYQALVDRDGLAYYPDWPVPGYYDVLVSATQKLINGTASPHEVLDELAGPYEENLANVGR